MKLKGKVHKYGANVDTDAIVPARHLNLSEPEDLAKHCMEDLDADFVKKVRPGDIIVAETNFGSGSSREHAPLAHQRVRRIGGGGQELRPHLLPQRHEHRPADRGVT